MNYKISKEYSEAIDTLKIIAIVMVLYIHSAGIVIHENIVEAGWLINFKYFISGIVSSCAVPIFFMLAGILLYKRDFTWKDNIKKKAKTLLIPYLLVNLIWIIIFLVAYQFDFAKSFYVNKDWIIQEWNIKDWIDAFIGYPIYPMAFPLWFIRDLLVLNILSKMIKILIDYYPKILFIIMFCLWIVNFNLHVFFLQYQSLFFFSMGYYIVRFKINLNTAKKVNLTWLSIMYILIIIIELITRNIYIHQLQILISVIFCVKLALKIKNNIFIKYSKYIFGIFLLHEWSLTILKKIIFKIIVINDINSLIVYIVTPVLVVILLIVFLKLLEKHVNKFYNVLTGYR